MKTEYHVLEALRAYASKSWHGKGCAKLVCGSTCLCGPCHARVALEQMAAAEAVEAVHVERAEKRMTTRATAPNGRWRILTKTSPSGKTLFVCLSCGEVHISPQKKCAEPVKNYKGEIRACSDWEPSPFEVQ